LIDYDNNRVKNAENPLLPGAGWAILVIREI
jgi:hypothetical protein